jgi:hypothetical protein
VFSAWRSATAVRDGNFKLVRDQHGGLALFDLAADPHEAHDVAAAHPDVKSRLIEQLGSFIRDNPLLDVQNQNVLKQLRALGYIE